MLLLKSGAKLQQIIALKSLQILLTYVNRNNKISSPRLRKFWLVFSVKGLEKYCFKHAGRLPTCGADGV